MAALELVITTISETTKKECTESRTLSAGSTVKMEIGNDDLSATVPVGKVWDVIGNVRIVERDA